MIRARSRAATVSADPRPAALTLELFAAEGAFDEAPQALPLRVLLADLALPELLGVLARDLALAPQHFQNVEGGALAALPLPLLPAFGL